MAEGEGAGGRCKRRSDSSRTSCWPEALKPPSGGAAHGVLAGVGAGPSLWGQVEELGKDLEMVRRLEEGAVAAVGGEGRPLRSAGGRRVIWPKRFRWYGVDVDGGDPEEVGTALRQRSIALQLAGGRLDEQGRGRPSEAETDKRWVRLVAIARSADSNSWRDRLRVRRLGQQGDTWAARRD